MLPEEIRLQIVEIRNSTSGSIQEMEPKLDNLLRTVLFIREATVKRVYAVVTTTINSDIKRPFVITKVILTSKGKNATINVPGSITKQILTLQYYDKWVEKIGSDIEKVLAPDLSRLENKIAEAISSFRSDSSEMKKISEKSEIIIIAEKNKHLKKLRTVFFALLSNGATESEIVKEWREQTCLSVHKN